MKRTAPNINALWGSMIIEELLRNGVNYFCISPGSRSAPLTVAAARNRAAKTIICYDERGAAFHALGYARAAGAPAALICTSGTAAANYFPAIIEAASDRVPMIILSADRPPELRRSGANQTIRQPQMFGEYVKWDFDLPCPDENIPPQIILTTVDQAVYQSRRAPAGPAHLNCMFREPLAPSEAPVRENYLQKIESRKRGNKAFTQYSDSRTILSDEDLKIVAEIINSASEGILTIGRLKNQEEIQAARQLAEKLDWPVFADITSGLRLDKSLPNLVACFDLLLLSEAFSERLQPQTVLHIGGQMVSKRWLQFTEKKRPQNYVVAQDHPERYDPVHAVTHRLESDTALFCQKLSPLIEAKPGKEWGRQISAQSAEAEKTIAAFLSGQSKISEIGAVYRVSRFIQPGSALFLASSMPIRDMDMFASPGAKDVSIAANRGASGIDGTIASAAGFAEGAGRPTTLLIGDLAFLHDLNSLHLLPSISQPLFIVLVNNRGGGIFSFLPIAEFKDVFEAYFGTPHQFNFRNAADLFGIEYFKAENNDEFIETYSAAQRNGKTAIIEIETNREENWRLHRQLQEEIVARLDN